MWPGTGREVVSCEGTCGVEWGAEGGRTDDAHVVEEERDALPRVQVAVFGTGKGGQLARI